MNTHLLKVKYGLEFADFEKLLNACGHRCPLCRRSFVHRTRPACVDHDHRSGLVRGLICGPCNEAIGMHHDNGGWFARVGSYLDSPPAAGVIGAHYVPGSIGAATCGH